MFSEATLQVGYDEIPYHSSPTSIGGAGFVNTGDIASYDGPRFVGQIDEVKLWVHTALTREEIRHVYDETMALL